MPAASACCAGTTSGRGCDDFLYFLASIVAPLFLGFFFSFETHNLHPARLHDYAGDTFCYTVRK